MRSSGKWFLYALFVIVATGVFLYMRFPEQAVRQYLTQQAGKYLAPYDLKIGSVSPAFPPGLILREVSLQHGRQLHAIFERLQIVPAYTPIFSPGRNLILTAGAYSGNITCKVKLSHGTKMPQVFAETTLADVDLEKADWLRNLTRRNISGRLSGKIFWDSADVVDPLRARLQIAAGRIDLQVPVFSLKSFTFNLVETDLALNRQRAIIQRCVFRGEQLAGDLSGSINRRSPFGESLLSLAGSFKIQPDFAAYLKRKLPEGFLPRKNAGSGYPIRFSGTLDKPWFSLK